jgi:hypothetical protein
MFWLASKVFNTCLVILVVCIPNAGLVYSEDRLHSAAFIIFSISFMTYKLCYAVVIREIIHEYDAMDPMDQQGNGIKKIIKSGVASVP